jgi:hypothetical protein
MYRSLIFLKKIPCAGIGTEGRLSVILLQSLKREVKLPTTENGMKSVGSNCGKILVKMLKEILNFLLKTGFHLFRNINFIFSNFRRVLNIVYVLLGISPASDCGLPTFRNALSVPSSKAGCGV